jgi:hypothetical protein
MREGGVVIDAIEIPTLDCLKIRVVSWHLVKAPIAAMRENVFVGKDAGNIVWRANGNDVEKKSPTGFKASGYFFERIR